ncbi:MAG: HlyC/CorC family transporter [Pseudomonadales bacterium]|nr:HlyC/CorC family transporter [Pseudomonadales bacterium]
MEFSFWIELLLFIALLGLSAFFSSAETSLFSLNDVQIEKMRADGHPRVGLIQQLLSEPRRLIVTILIGNEFVNVSASVLSAAMVIHLFGAENKLFNLFIMVPILLICGEITPKTLAIRNNVAFAAYQSGPIDLFARLIAPVRWTVRAVADWFTTLFVGTERSPGNIVTEDMVRTLAHEAVGEGALDNMEAQLIDHIFDFRNWTVEDLMTPRADVTFVPADAGGAEILDIFRTSRQSRMPVFEDHRDNVVGILHARDLLGIDIASLGSDAQPLRNILRGAYFVPESKSAADLFVSFQEGHKSFAVVVDEFGGVTGLITMGDLLEAIFGDIPTPSDEADEDWIRELLDGRFALPGATPIEDFNARFGTDLQVGELKTLGGLVLHHFGELPEEGDSIDVGLLRFWAQRIENNRIAEVAVAFPASEAANRMTPAPEAGVDGLEPTSPTGEIPPDGPEGTGP